MPRKTSRVDGVYQRKDRGGYWISWVDWQGRRRQRKTDAQTLAQARTILGAEKLRVENARVLGYAPPGKETVAELAARYLPYQRARLTPAAFVRVEGQLRLHILPVFGSRPLTAVRKADVEGYITRRSAQAGAATVLKETVTIKHMLKLAVEWELLPVNPAQGVRGPKPPAGRLRYLQPTELQRLIDCCPPWLKPIVTFAVCTGMRRGEILDLRWLDVDFAHHRALLPQTKNGDGRIVYLNRIAAGVLDSLPQGQPMNRVFPVSNEQYVRVAFERARKRAGIEDFRFHDLRHTAASWMRMRGADTDTVAQLLGHRDLRMARRYQHLSPGFLAEAVGKLDGVFGGAVGIPAGPSGVTGAAFSAPRVTVALPAPGAGTGNAA